MECEFDFLTIDVADAFKEKLVHYLKEENSTFHIDFSHVNKIDLSTIQLLLSLQKSLALKNRKLLLKNCTQSVSDALKLCGCIELLRCYNE